MSKKKKVIIGVSVSLLIIIMATLAIGKSLSSQTGGEAVFEEEEVLVQKVTEEALEETILVTGKIVPDGEQKIYQDAEHGEIEKFHVTEGAKVKKGDPLFEYDGRELEREFSAAVNARNMSQNNVKMIENQISDLDKQIANAKKVQHEPIVDEDGEEVFMSTGEDVRQLELEKNQLAIELESVKAEVALGQLEINEVDKRKKDLTVRSKIAGKVVKINKHESRGDDGIADPVVHIVSNKPFKVVGTMSEYDSVKIKKDQPVIIRPKVYKDREWDGTVESVSEFPTDDAGDEMDFYGGGDMNVTMYPFKVAIEGDTKELRQGFHVSLEVNVAGTEKALVVPHMAIMDELMLGMEAEDDSFVDEFFGMGDGFMDDEMQFVYVLADGVLQRRDIETGKMSDEFVEILSGVELDELVVVNPTADMYDGMEVATYDQVD